MKEPTGELSCLANSYWSIFWLDIEKCLSSMIFLAGLIISAPIWNPWLKLDLFLSLTFDRSLLVSRYPICLLADDPYINCIFLIIGWGLAAKVFSNILLLKLSYWVEAMLREFLKAKVDGILPMLILQTRWSMSFVMSWVKVSLSATMGGFPFLPVLLWRDLRTYAGPLIIERGMAERLSSLVERKGVSTFLGFLTRGLFTFLVAIKLNKI